MSNIEDDPNMVRCVHTQTGQVKYFSKQIIEKQAESFEATGYKKQQFPSAMVDLGGLSGEEIDANLKKAIEGLDKTPTAEPLEPTELPTAEPLENPEEKKEKPMRFKDFKKYLEGVKDVQTLKELKFKYVGNEIFLTAIDEKMGEVVYQNSNK
jgi:hypothetical protein